MGDTHLFCPYDGMPYNDTLICLKCTRARYIKAAKWEKALYKRQTFDDTFVPDSFLEIIETQEARRGYEYLSLVKNTTEIGYEFNSLVLFFSFYSLAIDSKYSGTVLIVSLMFVLFIGFIFYCVLSPIPERSLSIVRSGLLLLSTLYILSPVLMTINKNYANDTIYLMTSIFTLLHLIFFDYSFVYQESGEKYKVPGVTSLTFALMFTLMLTSRFAYMDMEARKQDSEPELYEDKFTGIHVFYTFSLTFVIFGFFPYLRRAVLRKSPETYRNSSIILNIFSAFFIAFDSWRRGFLILCVFLFMTYIAPGLLIYVYGYKNEIKGPWDLPKVKSY